MDRRSWPWRKKSSEKILGLVDSAEASPAHTTRLLDEQTMPRDQMGCFADEGTAQWQQSEDKVEQLKERLSVALLDTSAKDVLIKQHAKVAEEAVSGWEKAEQEALKLKQDLDSVMQQKLATEDRVSHLDSALKECMRQLRHVREEQEAKIHDATIKNLRDWERTRAQLEERLADMEKKYLDADAENKAISKLLQERAVTISKISETRSCAENNISALQSRLEAMERDYSTMKLDCSHLKKELETRNEEKLSSRRSTEAANKQHLEDARKIAKLEGECQRLRALVRNKLPNCGASMQTKLEADSSKFKNDSSRKKVCKGATPLREREEDIKLHKQQQESPNGGKDVEALSNRLSAMEDETRRLKELLARRDVELQHSRLMCARTASKLSSVEEQLDCLLHDKGPQKYSGMSALDKHIEAARSFTVSCEPSLASVSEDGHDDCSDAWASALISELAHIKIEKGTSQETGLDVPKMPHDNAIEVDHPVPLANNDTDCLEPKLAQKDVELYAANQLYEQSGDKMKFTEKELATVQSQNAAPDLSLEAVPYQFDAILQAHDNENEEDAILGKMREASGFTCHRKGQTEKVLVGFKQSPVAPSLTSAVSMLVEVVKTLDVMVPAPDLFCKSDETKAKIQKFVTESQLFLQGAADIVQILENMASILGDLVEIRLSERNIPLYATNRTLSADRVPLSIQDSDAFSSISDTTEPVVFDEQANKAMGTGMSRICTTLLEQEVTRLEGELRKVQGEKVALETHMRMEFQRFEGLHDQVAQLHADKVELEHLVEVVKDELDHLRIKLHRAEQAECSFQETLSSTELSRKLMDEQLQSVVSAKAEAESQLEMIKIEHIQLQDRKGVLERECAEKHEKITGLESKCQELAKQLSESSAFVCSKCSTTNGGETAHKEQEIADKLAECQQTISLLGKQLKTFTSSREQFNGYHDSSITKFEVYQSPKQLLHNAPAHHSEGRGLLEVCTGRSTYQQARIRVRAPKETDWEVQRDSNASDALDSELMSLSKSGRPLLELFGNKTPAHEHYIKALEQLTSSSEDEFTRPKRVEPLMAAKSSTKPPLHRKKKSQRSYTGVDMSKSMDDTSAEKVNTFTKFFSRAKNA
ncbi:hypothetical protein GOP47_0009383 [Adiantum capillus-veneris]|uniref:Filament-like plant protein 4 n=1 Tax=Adiantum capillus-veneris TaxID=13818 RepID=A0A9D4ZIN1_ADICA|nr:hypothetical protein GOP47_0009383 [Adiantum capillus-veneris]